jgi:predicted  nucleic acid-binding Zn-ribbon protein
VTDDLRKRVAQLEREAEQARERAAEAGRALLDAEARAAADRAAAALHEDALADARRAAAAAATSAAAELRAVEEREADLKREIERLEAELEQHKQWLIAVQSSRSWKITKPLRSLSR